MYVVTLVGTSYDTTFPRPGRSRPREARSVAIRSVILPRRNWESVLRDDEELVDLVRVPREGLRDGERSEIRRERRVAASVERVKINAVCAWLVVSEVAMEEEELESDSFE